MAPFGPAPAMVGNETSLSRPVSRRKLSIACDRVDFGQGAARRFAVEPGEEARHRHAVALVRGARAGDLDGVLHRLHRRQRIRAAHHLAAVLDDQPRDRLGTDARIEPHGAMLFAQRDQIALEGGARPHLGDLFEPLAHVAVELAQIDKQQRAALLRDHGEGQRHRRVRNVAAADVEQPGDGLRVRHHEHIGGEFLHFRADAGELAVGIFAGIAQIVRHDGAERRLRPVDPDGVDRIVFDRNEA